jgi:hypothetical protein
LDSYGGYGKAQTAFDVYLNKNSSINYQLPVDFSGISMSDSTIILATNNKYFKNVDDFSRIDYISYKDTKYLNVNIGRNSDMLFFVMEGSTLTDFDLYYSPDPTDKRKLTETTQLLDIAGNPVAVSYNGYVYKVYVKYLTEYFYQTYNGSNTLFAR